MKGLVGAPCWWGAWGPGPLGPLKFGPESSFDKRRVSGKHHAIFGPCPESGIEWDMRPAIILAHCLVFSTLLLFGTTLLKSVGLNL